MAKNPIKITKHRKNNTKMYLKINRLNNLELTEILIIKNYMTKNKTIR